jgi:hypothetical protein
MMQMVAVVVVDHEMARRMKDLGKRTDTQELDEEH